MPWCKTCQKPIQNVGLCAPCEQDALIVGDPFEDEDTEVMARPIIPVGKPDDICGSCMGTGDWVGPYDLLACPTCGGTGRVQY